MKIFNDTKDIKNYIKNLDQQTIGFVPTMGALHDGHLSIITQARQQCDIVVVSIFVNPTQFLENEDIDKYPHKQKADERICSLAQVDVLFLPAKEHIYFAQETKLLAPSSKAYILEGQDRPEHFDGVLQVVNKLFHIIQPNFAYFGKKDAQQLYLVQNMVRNFFLDIEIIACETNREPTGLARSSRNAYLSLEDIVKALKICKSLKTAVKLVQTGEYDTTIIKELIVKKLHGLHISYVAVVDRNFNNIDKIELNNTIILVAASINNTRLIDNIWL